MNYLQIFEKFETYKRIFDEKFSKFDLNDIESFLQVCVDHSDTFYSYLSICINDDFDRTVMLIDAKGNKTESKFGKTKPSIMITEYDPIYMFSEDTFSSKNIHTKVNINTVRSYLGNKFDAIMKNLICNSKGFFVVDINVECSKQDSIEIIGTMQDISETTNYRFIYGTYKTILTSRVSNNVSLKIHVLSKEDYDRIEKLKNI